jgi:hypothetical protein
LPTMSNQAKTRIGPRAFIEMALHGETTAFGLRIWLSPSR